MNDYLLIVGWISIPFIFCGLLYGVYCEMQRDIRLTRQPIGLKECEFYFKCSIFSDKNEVNIVQGKIKTFKQWSRYRYNVESTILKHISDSSRFKKLNKKHGDNLTLGVRSIRFVDMKTGFIGEEHTKTERPRRLVDVLYAVSRKQEFNGDRNES